MRNIGICSIRRPGSMLARVQPMTCCKGQQGEWMLSPRPIRKCVILVSRYIDFLIPGLIGMGLMGGGMWGIGFAIVDMRIRQLLKRFLGTPMKKSHFLTAMMTSRPFVHRPGDRGAAGLLKSALRESENLRELWT
ncbi:MAG: hypothetical protein R3B91_23360 [Planctomycetaceae bacterium]